MELQKFLQTALNVIRLQTAVHGVDAKNIVTTGSADANIPAGGLNPARIIQQAN